MANRWTSAAPWLGAVALVGLLVGYRAFHLAFVPDPDAIGLAAGAPAPPFADTFEGAAARAAGDHPLRLSPGQAVYRLLERSPGTRALAIEATVRAQALRRGPANWRMGRIAVGFRDAEGAENYRVPHHAVRIDGDRPRHTRSAVLLVPEPTVLLNVVIQNSGIAGIFEVESVALTPMRVAPWHRPAALALALAAALIALAAIRRGHLTASRSGIGIILTATVILAGTLVPQPWLERGLHLPRPAARSETSAPADASSIEAAAGTAPTPRAAPASPVTRPETHRLAHLVLFTLLGACAGSLARQAPPARARTLLAALVLFAAVTEALQALSISRTPRIDDWGIDLAGLVLGFAAVVAAGRFARKPRGHV